jgi:lysophospholipase L1-like esterase
MDIRNKTVLFLGSSVTYGSASGGVSFVDVIGDTCGCRCIKEAVSGTTLADIGSTSYVSRLKAVPYDTKVDLFVCQLSTNDATRKIELSKIEEAIRYILDYVKTTFHCPIVFYTGTIYKSEEYERMIDLLYDLKREYSFEILDLFNDEQMLKISQEDYKKYMQDPIHPTLLGYKEWWTPKFLDFFEQL